MDGTLIESVGIDYLAWKKIFGEYNISFSYDEYTGLLGISSSVVIKSYLGVEGAERDEILKRKLVYFREIAEESGLHATPYVASFLKKVKSIPLKMALATGARKEKMNFVFEKVPLKKYFDAFVTAEDVTYGKPAPELFLKAAGKLGVLPFECLVIEDAGNGVKAAKKANMKCLAITTTTQREKLSAADLIIDSFENVNILELLKKCTFAKCIFLFFLLCGMR